MHVQRLIHFTIDSCYKDFYPPRAVEFFKEYHSEEEIRRRHREGNVLVGKIKGVLIATGAITENNICAVFVHPDYQHRGYGRSLMIELEKIAKMQGHREAILSVSLPSRKFYENLGYKIQERLFIDVGDKQYLYYWRAQKTLI